MRLCEGAWRSYFVPWQVNASLMLCEGAWRSLYSGRQREVPCLLAGKSTMLRQVCLAALLAQAGAWVPAESLELTPVDAIFVRMGARDAIMSGQVRRLASFCPGLLVP